MTEYQYDAKIYVTNVSDLNRTKVIWQFSLIFVMAENQDAAVGAPQDQPNAFIVQGPTALVPEPQLNRTVLQGTEAFLPLEGAQPYGQPVVYYFPQYPLGGPVTQAPQSQLPTIIVRSSPFTVYTNCVNTNNCSVTQLNPDDVITDYTVAVTIIAIFCAILAFPSLSLGIPAIFLALQVSEK